MKPTCPHCGSTDLTVKVAANVPVVEVDEDLELIVDLDHVLPLLEPYRYGGVYCRSCGEGSDEFKHWIHCRLY